MYDTVLVPELEKLIYKDNLRELNHSSLERRTRGDSFTTYKILQHTDKVDKKTVNSKARTDEWKVIYQIKLCLKAIIRNTFRVRLRRVCDVQQRWIENGLRKPNVMKLQKMIKITETSSQPGLRRQQEDPPSGPGVHRLQTYKRNT